MTEQKRFAKLTTLALMCVVTATVLTGCDASVPEPEPVAEPFTLTEAAETYLTTICPVNDAWDEVDRLVDDMRSALVIQPDDLALRADELRGALGTLAEVSSAAHDAIEATLEAMPPAAQDPLEAMQQTLIADADQARAVAELTPDEIVDHVWEGIDENARIATDTRVALDLDVENAPTCADL